MTDKLRESLARMKGARPRAVSLADSGPVQLERLDPDWDLPVLARPALEGVSLEAWAGSHREVIDDRLRGTGGILFRGFGLTSAAELEAFCVALSPELMGYGERSTPRREVEGKVYTSTEYPADQHIPMHNELSYAHHWPRTIWFFCLEPAEEGGATPIADSRLVYRSIDPVVRQRFAEKGVMYVRNFGDGLGLSWREVFQADDPVAVEAYCREAGIEVEWRPGDRLRTRSVRPAVARYPRTGEDLWFNQAHLHHVSSLPAAVREALLEVVAAEDLPFNTFYGDGTEIGEAELDEVRRAYAEASIRFPWQRGDVLMLDNLLIAHGRDPYVGPRKILVAMA
jgi:alpha-ketoglutarate-dependent taurine dioxygenase